MKHLKKFNNLFEEEESMNNMDYNMENPEFEDPMITKNPPKAEAKSWIKSTRENADYDITWDSPDGQEITASFSDIGYPIEEEGVHGYSMFETVPGTSSDGNEYRASVSYLQQKEGVFEIETILIFEK